MRYCGSGFFELADGSARDVPPAARHPGRDVTADARPPWK